MVLFTENKNLESALTAEEKKQLSELKAIVLDPEFKAISIDVSDNVYHFGIGISKSGLDLIKRSPLHYASKHIEGNITEPTEAMKIGSMTHLAILEPEKFKAKFVSDDEIIKTVFKGKDVNRNTKLYKDAVANFTKNNFDKELIKIDVFEQISKMAESVQHHAFAKTLLSEGVTEQAIYWKDPQTNVLCKCKPDKLRPNNTIIDLKTTENASYDAFAYSIASYNYHVQSAWYSEGVKALTGCEKVLFVFIAVEKKDPYATVCYILRDDSFNKGAESTRIALARFAECVQSNTWPGYPDSDIEIPYWALNKE